MGNTGIRGTAEIQDFSDNTNSKLWVRLGDNKNFFTKLFARSPYWILDLVEGPERYEMALVGDCCRDSFYIISRTPISGKDARQNKQVQDWIAYGDEMGFGLDDKTLMYSRESC